jgi:hypothetical protein
MIPYSYSSRVVPEDISYTYKEKTINELQEIRIKLDNTENNCYLTIYIHDIWRTKHEILMGQLKKEIRDIRTVCISPHNGPCANCYWYGVPCSVVCQFDNLGLTEMSYVELCDIFDYRDTGVHKPEKPSTYQRIPLLFKKFHLNFFNDEPGNYYDYMKENRSEDEYF